MRKFLIISVLLFCCSGVIEAQLLEDTDRKLKDAKVERRGFLFFRSKKKAKRSEGIPTSQKGRGSIRYSSVSSPFRLSRQHSPRYSSPQQRAKRYALSVRYSPRNPFRGNAYQVSPRYSSINPFRGSKYKVVTRNSPNNPFRGGRFRITPRYSPRNPFIENEYKVVPRYSLGNPFTGAKYNLSPRYSPSNPFRGSRYNITPRYSQAKPFDRMKYRITPRYSQGMPFRGKDYNIKPRYSQGKPFKDKDYNISPRYTGTKVGVFKVIKDRELGVINYYHESSMWEGELKVKKNKIGDQHPSSNYHFAMKFQDPRIRKLLRKWNVYWTRINGNTQKSKGVKKSVDKPNFDKKERVIWNN